MGIFKKSKNEDPGYLDESKAKAVRQEIKIGLFLAIGLAILAVFIFVVGDFSTLFKAKGYMLYTHFATVAGLEKKTVVRMAGVKVGEVEAIQLKGSRAEVPWTSFRKSKSAGIQKPLLPPSDFWEKSILRSYQA